MRHQAIEVTFEQALAKPLGHAVGEARGRTVLIGSQDPAHALLAQVIGLVRLAQHCQLATAAVAVGLKFRRLLKQYVLVLDRDRRHIETEQAAGLPRVVAGSAHDVLGNDVALIRGHAPFTAASARDRGDFGVFIDLGAAGAGALA